MRNVIPSRDTRGEVLAALYSFAEAKGQAVRELLDTDEYNAEAVERALGEQTAAVEAHALVSNILGFGS